MRAVRWLRTAGSPVPRGGRASAISSPEAAAGGPIAAVEDGDRIIIDIPNRRLELDVPEEIIRERLAKVKPAYQTENTGA